MLSNSAMLLNLQNDLYRIISSALKGNNHKLEEISKTLTDIKDLLVTMNGETSGKEDL